MRAHRAMFLLSLPLLLGAEGDCGGSGDEGSPFGTGGSSAIGDGGSADGGSADGGSADGGAGGEDGGAEAGDDVFLSVAVECQGDHSEYTWTYSASLSIQASYVTVEVDPESADGEAWYLEPLDEAQTEWSLDVTELLSSRDCSRPAELLWTAFGFGSWEETLESSYSP